jgi:hypothetical protein
MRDVLDPVNPKELRFVFTCIHRQLQRQKVLEGYQYLDGYLGRSDGTGQFSSSNVNCKDCCSRNLASLRKNNITINYLVQ